MKKSDKIALKDKSVASLQSDIGAEHKKLSEALVKFSQGHHRDTSVFKKIKYQIAYLKTLISQKSTS
jgi:ribosomal protein L29